MTRVDLIGLIYVLYPEVFFRERLNDFVGNYIFQLMKDPTPSSFLSVIDLSISSTPALLVILLLCLSSLLLHVLFFSLLSQGQLLIPNKCASDHFTLILDSVIH